VQAAVVSGSNPVDCEVYIDNELAGYYKGRDPGHLERNIKYRLEEVGRKVDLRVAPVAQAGHATEALSEPPSEPTPVAGVPEAMAEAESSPSDQG